jgi:hypothetical protein
MERKALPERKIVPIDESFTPLLHAAAMSGCDVTPKIAGVRYVGFGHGDYGYGPVCLVDVTETAFVAEPHVIWLPWCPPRERIEAFKWSMEYFSKSKQVLLIILKPYKDFYEHFVKRGQLRKIGFVDSLPAEAGEEIHMYQYVRKK